MDTLISLRLDKTTYERIARIARDRRLSNSEVIREALDAWLQRHETTSAPYDRVADLLGVARGGKPRRSSQTRRQFTKLLKGRRSRD